jgi:hypothetical protein
MKQKMSWAFGLHSGGTFDEFQKAVRVVLEHHFNNHDLSEDWHKAKQGTDKEKHNFTFLLQRK